MAGMAANTTQIRGIACKEQKDFTNLSECCWRETLFTRIVPNIKTIGLWGPRIQKAYAEMGILGFADVDAEALQADDERVAEEFDRHHGIRPESLRS